MEYYENAQRALSELLNKRPFLSGNKNTAYEKGILAAKSIAKNVHETGGSRIDVLNRLHEKLKVKPSDITVKNMWMHIMQGYRRRLNILSLSLKQRIGGRQ